jgi:YHS domain-containing protein
VLRALLIGIVLILVARAFWRVIDGVLEGATGPRRQVRPGMKLEKDPVCGTYVSPNLALSLTGGGKTHYFCSDTCRDKYRHEHAR